MKKMNWIIIIYLCTENIFFTLICRLEIIIKIRVWQRRFFTAVFPVTFGTLAPIIFHCKSIEQKWRFAKLTREMLSTKAFRCKIVRFSKNRTRVDWAWIKRSKPMVRRVRFWSFAIMLPLYSDGIRFETQLNLRAACHNSCKWVPAVCC